VGPQGHKAYQGHKVYKVRLELMAPLVRRECKASRASLGLREFKEYRALQVQMAPQGLKVRKAYRALQDHKEFKVYKGRRGL
jgi:hypothetical protein